MSEVRFYVWDCPATRPALPSLPNGVSVSIERPGPSDRSVPRRYAVWWLWHQLRFFRNRDYAVVFVTVEGQQVHRSALFPRWWRFRFMGPRDLQIGDTWTEPESRGRGYASLVLEWIQSECWTNNRRFWYLVEQDNPASIRVVEKAGFKLVGTGAKIPGGPAGLRDEYKILTSCLVGSEERLGSIR